MADYYVNADSADDSGSGLTHGSPKKYLASALALLTFPITTETTIHLDPNTTADYTVAGNLLTFEHYTFSGSGSLTIQPYGWNQPYYIQRGARSPHRRDGAESDGGQAVCVVVRHFAARDAMLRAARGGIGVRLGARQRVSRDAELPGQGDVLPRQQRFDRVRGALRIGIDGGE